MDLPQPVIEQPAEQASQQERSYVRDDGTLVINIMVDPPCGEVSEGEIVVCAPDGSENGLNAPERPPEEPVKAEVELSKNAKIDLHGASDAQTGADQLMVGLTIKF